MAHRPYEPRDHYAKKARDEKFVARSVFKLEELDRRFRLLRPDDRIVDLGCAPGSWLQYAQRAVGPSGTVLGIDLAPVRAGLAPNVTVLERDVTKVTDSEIRTALRGAADVVLSDMAPKTSGVRIVDQARSQSLCDAALSIAEGVLKPGGHFLVKVFQGPDTPEFLKRLRERFEKVEAMKPQSSRSESMEVYVAAKGMKRTGSS